MSGALICETVVGASMAELRARRDAATRADIVELRLDGVADPDVAGALRDRRTPVVVTCRPAWDGGRWMGDEGSRLALLAEAVRLGAEYVDVEHAAEWTRVPASERTRRIVSFHDWTGVPADLAGRVRDMRATGALVKVAVMAARLRDCVALRDACAAGDARSGQVAIAMGPRGQLTRVCPWLVRSCWTYAGHAAPGQLSCDALIDEYRVRAGGPSTAIYAVAGRPVAHSASPAMHNRAFAETGLDAVYASLDADSAADALDAAVAFGVAGLSVTAPFKAEMARAVTRVDERVLALGAANTLRWRSGAGWEARNFDAEGFLDPIDRAGVELPGRRVLVLGAGGAARAVVWALAGRGADVTVAARRRGQAEALAGELAARVTGWPPAGTWDLVVNATPVGTWPAVEDRPPLPQVGPGVLAYDLVYNPPETAWLRDAARAGAHVLGGLAMLASQACRQFEWWTGRTAPRAAMEAAALAFVTEENRTVA